LAAVKTISIKQLHARTGHWVRAARTTPVIVTDRGEKIATLQPHLEPTRPAAVIDWAARKKWMPVSSIDSTVFISEDRDGR
jgi:antitoxin (DNA-binding transcriptional repressor) of toxin-antitoxin stability system